MLCSLLLTAVALVPAPREFVPCDGVYAYAMKLPCPVSYWRDYDVVGGCLDLLTAKFVQDASLPPEGYRLKVSPDGVEISAADSAGAFYARKTLEQLSRKTATNAIEIACCVIRDWPRYRWRGMMIDEARNFLGKNAVFRVLDLMAMHKMNVFHWHLVDDQGWRLEIRRHPELVQFGAMRPCSVQLGKSTRYYSKTEWTYPHDTQVYGPFFYTQEDVREILAYARERHITVVPEIELPGHVRALLAAHPEFSCKGDLPRIPRINWSIEKEVLCVGNDAAVAFMEDVLDEVCALFPDSPYIHIGGDECPRDRWKTCPKCQARMRRERLKDENGLQAWIVSRMVRYLDKKGRRAVGWDEMLAGDVPKSSVGMSWRLSQKGGAGTHYVSSAEAVGRGYDMIIANKDYCYLSRRQFEADDPYPYYGQWHGKPLTLEHVYAFDPCAGIPESGKKHVLGGQACIWGEVVVTHFDLEWKTWPRACAMAEALWTASEKRDFNDFFNRMQEHRSRLVAKYVNCAPLRREPLMVLHMDFNTIQMKKAAVVDCLRKAAAAGYNAVLWEIENKVRWTSCPESVHPEAFSKEEFREILAEADRLGLRPIPLMQTFGHAEYVLMTGRHPDWIEDASFPACYCVSNPEVLAFQKRLLHEYLELFGPSVKDFHLGGDEAIVFGTCPKCRQQDRVGLYAAHLKAVAEELDVRGIRPGIWADRICAMTNRADIAKIPARFTLWNWNYGLGVEDEKPGRETKIGMLKKMGYDIIFGCASQSVKDSTFLPRYDRHRDNIIAAADLVRKEGLRGLCMTSWSVHLFPKSLQYPLWDFAAKRLRAPSPDAADDYARILRQYYGDVNSEALDRVAQWSMDFMRFDSRIKKGYMKPAQPAEAGRLEKILAALGTRDSGRRQNLLKKVDAARNEVSCAAAALKRGAVPGSPRATVVEAAALTVDFYGAIRAALAGEEVKAPIARTRDFYAHEQSPQSADNSTALVWSILNQPVAESPSATKEKHEAK